MIKLVKLITKVVKNLRNHQEEAGHEVGTKGTEVNLKIEKVQEVVKGVEVNLEVGGGQEVLVEEKAIEALLEDDHIVDLLGIGEVSPILVKSAKGKLIPL